MIDVRLYVALGLVSTLACGRIGFDPLQSGGSDASAEVDATTLGTPDAGAAIDAKVQLPMIDAGIPLSLSQSTNSTMIIPQWTFGCHQSANNPWITGENFYIRRFDLSAEGVSAPFTIHTIRMGITEAIAGDGSGSQSATLNDYQVSGALVTANMSLVKSLPLTVPDQVDKFTNISIDVTLPGNSVFAVEYYVADGTAANNTLTLGYNNLGETQPTYHRMPGCGYDEVTDIDTIDPFYESFHLIMEVSGTY